MDIPIQINCKDIQIGDYIVGFNKIVKEVNKYDDSHIIYIKFGDRETWETCDHFNTHVIRNNQ